MLAGTLQGQVSGLGGVEEWQCQAPCMLQVAERSKVRRAALQGVLWGLLQFNVMICDRTASCFLYCLPQVPPGSLKAT